MQTRRDKDEKEGLLGLALPQNRLLHHTAVIFGQSQSCLTTKDSSSIGQPGLMVRHVPVIGAERSWQTLPSSSPVVPLTLASVARVRACGRLHSCDLVEDLEVPTKLKADFFELGLFLADLENQAFCLTSAASGSILSTIG